MERITLDGPEAITLSGGTGEAVERDARLLVAGEYPGKGLTVTEADIDSLVAHFSDPVPVKVEHIDSPLDPLGHVRKVWRDGGQLMGRVAFPAAMAAFLSARGAAKLSVGLLKEPAWKLLEASLTLRPHVPGATLLSGGDPSERDPSGLASQPTSPERGGEEGRAAELARLRAERLDAQITRLKAAGRLVPAAEPLARALLAAPGVVTLSDGGAAEPMGEVFRKFLEAQPPVVRLSEMARGHRADAEAQDGLYGPAGDGGHFSADEREVLRRLGVEPAEVARTMARDRMKTNSRKGGA